MLQGSGGKLVIEADTMAIIWFFWSVVIFSSPEHTGGREDEDEDGEDGGTRKVTGT